MEAVEEMLNKFGRQVVAQTKTTLNYKKGSTNLEKSISYKVRKTAYGFSLQFFMDSYGKFLDKGVSGTKIKRNYKDYKSKVISSPYTYTTKGPPVDILSKWIKKKGLKPKGIKRGRSKTTGQFISGLSYLISRKIKRDGIKSLSFFQKPLGLGIKQFAPQMLESIKEDITNKLIATGKWQQQ